MNKVIQPGDGATTTPTGRPPREDLLLPILEGTKRTFVPVRRAFIQKPRGTQGSRGASLARLARDGFTLDAYLLIHALASSSEPYVAAYPAATWVQLACLDESASFEAAKSRWSKLVTRLSTLQLVERDTQRNGRLMQYKLLHESGDGSAYTRPKNTSDGNWFRLPHTYWTEGFDKSLTHPQKLMLLVALDQPDEFKLPLNQSARWYGVSESTARRGLRGLEDLSLLRKTENFVPSHKSPTGWMEEFRYTLQGPFAKSTIAASASSTSRGRLHPKKADDA